MCSNEDRAQPKINTWINKKLNHKKCLCWLLYWFPRTSCNKLPHTGWLKRTEICLSVLEAGSLKSRCWQSCSFLRFWACDLPASLEFYGHAWCSLLTDTSLRSLPLSSPACSLCLCKSFSPYQASVIVFRAHPNPVRRHLKLIISAKTPFLCKIISTSAENWDSDRSFPGTQPNSSCTLTRIESQNSRPFCDVHLSLDCYVPTETGLHGSLRCIFKYSCTHWGYMIKCKIFF